MSGLKEYLDTLDNKTKANCYSVAISSIHKAIRMRMPELSIAPTKIAWNINQWRFKNRMLICLTEDCCRDYELLEWISDNYLKKVETEEGSVELVKRMCESYKGKEGNFCKCGLLDWEDNEQQIAFNKENISKLIPENFYEAYKIEVPIDTMIEEYKKNYDVPKWLEHLMILCYKMNLDKERQGVLIPIFYNLDGKKTIVDSYDLCSKGADLSYDDMFLYNGVDVHTFVGKMALNIARKKGMFNFIENNFDDTIWHLMMGNYRGVQKQADGFCLTRAERDMYVTPEIEKGWDNIIDNYNGLRKWAIDKFIPEFVTMCKYALDFENFVVPPKDEPLQLELNFGE